MKASDHPYGRGSDRGGSSAPSSLPRLANWSTCFDNPTVKNLIIQEDGNINNPDEFYALLAWINEPKGKGP